MKKTRTVKSRLKILVVASVLVVALVVGVLSILLSLSSVKEDFCKSAEIATSHLRDALENGSHNWRYEESEGRLYCGEREVTVDLFETMHAADETVYHTVFWDNLRVLTNIKNEAGAYAIGTTADPEIYAKVKSGNTYTKNGVTIFGASYTVCYMPIYAGESFCGMVFTGIEQSAVNSSLFSLALWITVGVIVVMAVMVFLAGKILNGVSGSLAQKLDNGYDELEDFSKDVRVISRRADKEVADINLAMNNVAQGATGQAAATEEAMASTEEFSSSMDVVNDEIEQCFKLLEDIVKGLGESEQSIGELDSNIHANSAVVENISENIAEGVAASRNVKAVVKTIDELAFQINLLALNAAVEASHAGEFGRGFAVVADEIKNLANNSAQSANETAEIIGEIVDTMSKTEASNEKLVNANKIQLEKSAIVSEKIEILGRHISAISDKLDNIRERSEALQSVRGELVTVVQNLSATAQENAAISQEVCASSETVGKNISDLNTKVESLNDIRKDLKDIVDYFG